MNKLKVAVLLLCAALCVSCENPFLKGLLPQDIERNIIGQSPTVPDPEAPFVEGAASIIAAAATPKTMFRISVVTVDNSAVAVEGEGGIVTTLASGTYTTLAVATGATVILRGNIKSIDYSIHNASSSIDVRGLSNLQYLYCHNSSGLTSIKVQGCASLQGLYCKGNRLTSLNVQGCSSLKYLDCAENRLTSLNVQGCSSLQSLNCRENRLTSLDVQGLNALQFLGCYSNQLTSLNVQGCSSLQGLQCANNQLTSLNAQGCSSLQNLNCRENRLTSLDVQGLNALQFLGCYSNQLTSLDVQGLSALKSLDCYSNQLTALNVQGCSSLGSLNCWGNRLTAQAFTKLFTDLPVRSNTDNANCTLYTERTDITEGNHTDFTSPSDLQAAFNHAKNIKKWTMYKVGAKGSVVL